MKQISYDQKPKLYIVPTPIGNLEDMTIRSINILKDADVILAEDTRITRKLLNYFQITKRIISNNKNNEHENANKILALLDENKKIALVTDRGTPLISDPGNVLVKKVIEKGYNVICLPGATALIPAVVVSGLKTEKFLFYGFLDSKESKKKEQLNELMTCKESIIFYEAPHRLLKTIKSMKEIFGNRKISLIREISKLYEEVIRSDLFNVENEIEIIKGEYVIVLEGNENLVDPVIDLNSEDLFNMYIKQGLTKNEAIKKIAKVKKVSKNEIYKLFNN